MSRALEKSLLNTGRTRARRYLLDRSDRFLLDNGFSRELLERGNGAWPWRLEAVEPWAPSGAGFTAESTRAPVSRRLDSRSKLSEAVAELNALSDAELSDLGISRAGIVEAVRRGRPGIDRVADEPKDRMAA